MYVTPIQHYNYSVKKQPSFGLNSREYKTIQGFGLKVVKNSTIMSRGDLDWETFARVIACLFKDKKKVNVYSAACSDGSEAYTLIIQLLEQLGKKDSEKFFPIIASDADRIILKTAESKLLNLGTFEARSIANFDRYFEKASEKMHIKRDYVDMITQTYCVKPELSNHVIFEKMSILKRIKSINDNSDTIFMCRNVFPYFKNLNEVKQVIQSASEKLKPGSLFVTGDYDFKRNAHIIENYFKEAGFKEIMTNVYQRIMNQLA